MRRGSKMNDENKSGEEDISIEMGSGNVFADIGLPNPELLLAKADLVHRISLLIEARKLTQTKAAKLIGLPQPKLSALLRGQTKGFTIDRLVRLLNALGQRVEISLKDVAPTSRGRKIAVV